MLPEPTPSALEEAGLTLGDWEDAHRREREYYEGWCRAYAIPLDVRSSCIWAAGYQAGYRAADGAASHTTVSICLENHLWEAGYRAGSAQAAEDE